MEVTKSQLSTSADTKSIGFDYQFLYFVYRALELKPEEKIGYEVKDDVHLELEDGTEILLQLKHSVQTNSDNSIINMTEKDLDLWKSLYNWNSTINDIKEDKRSKYIENTEFVLVTNKNNRNNNFFIKSEELKNNKITILDYKNYISGLKLKKEDSDYAKKLNKYINLLILQDNDILLKFIKKLNCTFAFDDLVEKIKNQILSKFIDIRKLDEIFERCVGNLTIWKYDTIKKGDHVIISFEDIDKRLKNCFIYGRNNDLPRYKKRDVNLPDRLEEQAFIRELIEIKAVKSEQKAKIARYTSFRLKIENLFDLWIQENYITETEREEFINECITLWSNCHEKAHRSSNKAIDNDSILKDQLEELLCDNAIKCLDDIRDKTLNLCNESLTIEESNGTFYSLSEQREIGWKLEWERKYEDE